MVEKTTTSISKLMAIDMNMQQAYIYFNIYLIRSIFLDVV